MNNSSGGEFVGKSLKIGWIRVSSGKSGSNRREKRGRKTDSRDCQIITKKSGDFAPKSRGNLQPFPKLVTDKAKALSSEYDNFPEE